ncbi:hypothetical protein J6T93_08325 [bacterium]|nr:hypothetical protein [bacterium]
MKKLLVLLLGIAVIYAAYVFFYRPNLLINGKFSRDIAGWQFAKKGDAERVSPENEGEFAYLALAPGGEMCQFFLSGIAAGEVCEASFKCRTAKPNGRLTFRLDSHTYALISVTNSDWRTVRFLFPAFDYADRRSFRLVAGKNSPVDVADVSFRRAVPFHKARLTMLEGELVTNLVTNGDFMDGTLGWESPDENDLHVFDKRGVPTLMFEQSSNVVLTASQTVQVKKGVPYIVSGYALMDDNRMANRVANIRVSYNDDRYRSNDLKFSSPNRGIWIRGSLRILPKADCKLTITLRCEHSRGKAPGKVYFNGIRVSPADEVISSEPPAK